MSNTKPVSVAVKVMLIETLHGLEQVYNANFEEYQKAIKEELAKPEINRMIVREYESERDYWRFEYAKINQIKRLIKDLPEVNGFAYKITEETAEATVYEVEQ